MASFEHKNLAQIWDVQRAKSITSTKYELKQNFEKHLNFEGTAFATKKDDAATLSIYSCGNDDNTIQIFELNLKANNSTKD